MPGPIAPLALIAAVLSTPAAPADWWLVNDTRGGDARGAASATFADVDSLNRQDDIVQLRVLRIDRKGQASETSERIECTPAIADPLGRFACATPEERDRYGLILAGVRPEEVAQMVFGVGSQTAPRMGFQPEQ
jgi:hypothetical protein